MLTLKPYQERALEKLRDFLRGARRLGARTAFIQATDRPYREVSELPSLPYVCLRMPTGGGKTLVAACSIPLVAREFLGSDRATVLWLVPSNVIRDQTLAALRDRSHPYRQAIDAAATGPVSVLDLAEALSVQRSTLDGETTVLVSTLAALRVQDTEGRKIYEENGALTSHFSGLSEEQRRVLDAVDGPQPKPSLANALALRRPLVIMDEAHNARTRLSFATLARFQPSVILELTATPELEHKPDLERFASNVLHSVSALELKVTEMIKLPIELLTRPSWQDVVAGAITKRQELEEIARQAAGAAKPIRPLVLFQAQPRREGQETLSVERLRKELVENFNVDPAQIATAAYDADEIAGVDLEAGDCPIRFILTVQKLREGWDCPWAYILCSVAEQVSATAVEQILGRVLRLPGARKQSHDALNQAYAYVASTNFVSTATSLTDALVQNGFERIDAEALIRAAAPPRGQTPLPLFAQYSEPVPEQPDLRSLPSPLASRLRFDPAVAVLTVDGPISTLEEARLVETVSTPAAREAVRRLGAKSRGESPSPFEPLRVPRLAIEVDGQLELFDEQHFLDVPWSLAQASAELSEEEFTTSPSSARAGQIDIDEDRGRVEIFPYSEELERQLGMFRGESGWSVPGLASWLDRQIRHPDLSQVEVSTYFQRILERLLEARNMDVGDLARHRFRLRASLERRVAELRSQVQADILQTTLFDSPHDVRTANELSLVFEVENYAPSFRCSGAYQFRKHVFPGLVGELKNDGEEYQCACKLDNLNVVECWVRNLAGPGADRERTSFWLQTPSGKFYPDFVARLKDGRILVIEYKGAHLAPHVKEQDKRRVGELWAERSGGSCLFSFPTCLADLDALLRSLTQE